MRKGASTNGWIGEEVLRVAARNGRIYVIQDLLHEKVNLNSTSGPDHVFMYTPLMEAARNNQIDAMKLLIDNGAKIDQVIESSDVEIHKTALMFACEGRHPEAVKLLIENNADINTVIKYAGNFSGPDSDWNPIMMTFNGNFYEYSPKDHLDTLKILIFAGSIINHEDIYGKTALDYAEINGYEKQKEIMSLLLQNGAKKGSNKLSQNETNKIDKDVMYELWDDLYDREINIRNLDKKVKLYDIFMGGSLGGNSIPDLFYQRCDNDVYYENAIFGVAPEIIKNDLIGCKDKELIEFYTIDMENYKTVKGSAHKYFLGIKNNNCYLRKMDSKTWVDFEIIFLEEKSDEREDDKSDQYTSTGNEKIWIIEFRSDYFNGKYIITREETYNIW